MPGPSLTSSSASCSPPVSVCPSCTECFCAQGKFKRENSSTSSSLFCRVSLSVICCLSVCPGEVQPAVLPAVFRVRAVPLLCQSARHSLSVCLCAQAKFKREFRQLFSMLLCESVRHSLSICLCAQGKFNQQFCQLFSVLPCCRENSSTSCSLC